MARAALDAPGAVVNRPVIYSMLGSLCIAVYPEWGIRGNRGIWAENELWYYDCSLWDRLPQHDIYASSCRGAAELDHDEYAVPSHVHFSGFGSRIPMAAPRAIALPTRHPVYTRWCVNRHVLDQWRYCWVRVQRNGELG